MNKNMHSNHRHYVTLFACLTFVLSILLVSCKDSSTSSEDPDDNDFETCGDTLKDVDGNRYKTIQFGDQCWTAEDMRARSYNDGSAILNIEDDEIWASMSMGAWAYYANDEFNSDINGKMYNWYAVNNSRGICPTGWRVPSDDDWKTLEITLGMTPEQADGVEWRGDDEGEILRDSNGFSAVLGGSRSGNGAFSAGGNNGAWWSSTSYNDFNAWARFLYHDTAKVYRNNYDKRNGSFVRCLLN